MLIDGFIANGIDGKNITASDLDENKLNQQAAEDVLPLSLGIY